MPINVLCPECDHEWEEGPSKIGRSIACPECGRKTRVTRENKRPAAANSNLPRTMLIGGTIFLVGVLGMFGLKYAQISATESEDDPPIVEQPEPANDEDSVVISSSGDTVADVPTEESVAVAVTPSETSAASPTTTTTPMTSAVTQLPNASNTDRGRELLAEMSHVGLKVDGFQSDARGAVKDAVETAVSDAIQQCQLSVGDPTNEPKMVVELQMQGEKLMISAHLLALDNQQKVSVWSRSGTVAKLSEKATTTGILPTSLGRDVATFFKSLRLELNEARRQFPS